MFSITEQPSQALVGKKLSPPIVVKSDSKSTETDVCSMFATAALCNTDESLLIGGLKGTLAMSASLVVETCGMKKIVFKFSNLAVLSPGEYFFRVDIYEKRAEEIKKIADMKTEILQISPAATLAPVPPDKKRPQSAPPNRKSKRARTNLAELTSVSSLSNSNIDERSDIGSEEDLSACDDVALEPPPTLEEGHPFLAVVDELTKTALSDFSTWQKTAPQPTRFFACPFRARYQTQYKACLRNAALQCPLDVKRHLWRDHRLPNYCPACYAVFDKASECITHVVQRNCERSSPHRLEGVSEYQKELLERQKIAGASDEVRWLAIWDVLFPGEPWPSPFPDGDVDSAVAKAREFWGVKGREVVAEFLRERGLLSWDVKDEERGLAALYKLILKRLIEEVYGEAAHGVEKED